MPRETASPVPASRSAASLRTDSAPRGSPRPRRPKPARVSIAARSRSRPGLPRNRSASCRASVGSGASNRSDCCDRVESRSVSPPPLRAGSRSGSIHTTCERTDQRSGAASRKRGHDPRCSDDYQRTPKISPQGVPLLIETLQRLTPSRFPGGEIPRTARDDCCNPYRAHLRTRRQIEQRVGELYEFLGCRRLLTGQAAAALGQQSLKFIATELGSVPIGNDE